MKISSIVRILNGCITLGEEMTIRGWVRTRRDSKIGLSFLAIYDGSCFHSLQVIANKNLCNYKNEILHLTTGCSVEVTGIVKHSIGHEQKFELFATRVIVIGMVDNPDNYPISAKQHSVEYLREFAHLRPRTNLIGAVTRVRNTLAQTIHRFFNEEGYIWVSTPIITSSDTEGIGKMFRVSTLDFNNLASIGKDNRDSKEPGIGGIGVGEVNFDQDFFSRESFLTVSGQLHGEAYACALSKIYTFGPTFRAENSNTSRHLAEFWMVEPEIAFADLDDISSISEQMLKYIFKDVLQQRNDDLTFFSRHIDKQVINRLEKSIDSDFAQINYTDAIKALKNCGQHFKTPVVWGINLSYEHELYLVEQYFKKPVIVKNYPKDIKAFYMHLNDDNETVAAMDVLVPGVGEIIGGSQRENRLNKLDARMQEKGITNQNYYNWYRDLRRYGAVPHAGFGLGFERLVAYVTGVKNIRDTIPFPRTPRTIFF